jgi:hypothetical protein
VLPRQQPSNCIIYLNQTAGIGGGDTLLPRDKKCLGGREHIHRRRDRATGECFVTVRSAWMPL